MNKTTVWYTPEDYSSVASPLPYHSRPGLIVLRTVDWEWAHQSRYYTEALPAFSVLSQLSSLTERYVRSTHIVVLASNLYSYKATHSFANQTMSNRRIAALANLGVKSIHSGRYNSAILTLKHAVSCLASRSLQQNLLLGASDTNYIGASSSSVFLTRMPLRHLEEEYFREVSAHNPFTGVTSPCTYEQDLDTVEFSSEIAMVLFCNLGLAHHLAGLFHGAESQEHLQHALMNYKRSLALFHSTEGPRLECWASFVLGLINNIGHSFRHFGESTKALECIAYMEVVISSPAASDLTEEDEIEISTSIFCGKRCDTAPCA